MSQPLNAETTAAREPKLIRIERAPLEELVEAGTEQLIASMNRGNLDARGQRLQTALRDMVAYVALAKFDERLPAPPVRSGEG